MPEISNPPTQRARKRVPLATAVRESSRSSDSAEHPPPPTPPPGLLASEPDPSAKAVTLVVAAWIDPAATPKLRKEILIAGTDTNTPITLSHDAATGPALFIDLLCQCASACTPLGPLHKSWLEGSHDFPQSTRDKLTQRAGFPEFCFTLLCHPDEVLEVSGTYFRGVFSRCRSDSGARTRGQAFKSTLEAIYKKFFSESQLIEGQSGDGSLFLIRCCLARSGIAIYLRTPAYGLDAIPAVYLRHGGESLRRQIDALRREAGM